MKPQISVIIRAYNEEKTIGECLRAVFSQKTGLPFEVIIVDSESADKTREIAGKFPARIIKIKKEDFTYGRALNSGCSAARGKFLVFLSAHAVPAGKNWLESFIKNFDNPRIAGVYGKQIPAEDCNPLTKRQMLAHWKDAPSIQSNDPFFANPNSAIKKDIWQDIKFNENMPGTEDHDWAKRAQKRGYLIAYEPKAAVTHSHNETFKQIFSRNYRETCGNLSVYNKTRIFRYLATGPYYFCMDIIYIMKNNYSIAWIPRSFIANGLFTASAFLAFLRILARKK